MSETAEQSGPDLKPTPTPWEVERHTNGVIFITALHARCGDIADLYHVHSPNHGEPVIVQKDNAEANAALIVTAVNAMAPMKEAAAVIVSALKTQEDYLVETASKLGSDDESFLISFGEARALRAALRLAEGGTE